MVEAHAGGEATPVRLWSHSSSGLFHCRFPGPFERRGIRGDAGVGGRGQAATTTLAEL